MSARLRALLAVGAAALLWAGVVVAIHRESPRTLVSAHGLLHAAIVEEIRAGGPLPPANPFLAGKPLLYYWTFHWLGARVADALGTDPLHALEYLVVGALVVLVLAGGWLGWRWYGSALPAVAVSFLVLAGCHPHGPLLLVLRYLRHGQELFAGEGEYLWGLVHPLNQHMRLFDPWSMHGPLVSFFVNITARPLGLAALLLVVVALVALRQGAGWRAWLGLLLATAACAAASSVLGLGVAVALAAVLLAEAWQARAQGREALRRALAPATALGAGLLLALPTYHHLVDHGGASLKSPPAMLEYLRGALASAWLLALLAVTGWRALEGEARRSSRVLLCTAALLAAAAVVIELPVGNEDNWFHGGLLLLAPPAAAWLRPQLLRPAWLRSPGLRAALLCLAFLPPVYLQLYSYTGRRDIDIAAAGNRLHSSYPLLEDLYRFLREDTPPDAVIVMDPFTPYRAAGGNTLELPALTGRHVLTEKARHYVAAPEREARLRQHLALRLTRGQRVPAAEEHILRPLRRPVYILTFELAEVGPRLTEQFGPPAFQNVLAAVFRWRPVDG